MDKLNFANTDNSLKYNDDIWMTIKENGNIGIGNENPSYTLDVSGSVNASGNVKFGKISDLNGINSATPSKGEHLMWNDASGNWKPGMNTNWKKNNDNWYYDGSGVAIGRENLGGIKELTADNINQIQKITTDVSGIATGIGYQKNNRIAFDGKYAIFGDPDISSAHIYKYNGSNWEKQTTIAPSTTGTSESVSGPLASKADKFGYSVDIHENFVIISDINYNNNGQVANKGAVFIYERVGENWEFRNWYWPSLAATSYKDESRSTTHITYFLPYTNTTGWGTVVSIAKLEDYLYLLITAPGWTHFAPGGYLGPEKPGGVGAFWFKQYLGEGSTWVVNKGRQRNSQSNNQSTGTAPLHFLTCSRKTKYDQTTLGYGWYTRNTYPGFAYSDSGFGSSNAAIDKKSGTVVISSPNGITGVGITNHIGGSGVVFAWYAYNSSNSWEGKKLGGGDAVQDAPAYPTNKLLWKPNDSENFTALGNSIAYVYGYANQSHGHNRWNGGYSEIPLDSSTLGSTTRSYLGFGYRVSIYNNKLVIGDKYGSVYSTVVPQVVFYYSISYQVGRSIEKIDEGYYGNVKLKSVQIQDSNYSWDVIYNSGDGTADYNLSINENNTIVSSWNDASYNKIEIFENAFQAVTYVDIPPTGVQITKIGEITVTNTTKVEHVQLDDNYATIYFKDDNKFDFHSFPYILVYNSAVEGNAHVENELHVGGNVGINVVPPEYKLHVNGEARTTSSWGTSDDRLKHNEQSLTTPLETIMKLEPKHYFKTKELHDISHNFTLDASGYPVDFSNNRLVEGKDYTRETGIIAQDIQKIPELAFSVRESDYGDRPMAVNYNNIHCTHIAATKELNVKFEALSVKNTELKAKNSELKQSLEQIKQHQAN